MSRAKIYSKLGKHSQHEEISIDTAMFSEYKKSKEWAFHDGGGVFLLLSTSTLTSSDGCDKTFFNDLSRVSFMGPTCSKHCLSAVSQKDMAHESYSMDILSTFYPASQVDNRVIRIRKNIKFVKVLAQNKDDSVWKISGKTAENQELGMKLFLSLSCKFSRI